MPPPCKITKFIQCMGKKTRQLWVCGLKVSFDPYSLVFALDTLFLQMIGRFMRISEWPIGVLQRYGSYHSDYVHHSNKWPVVMDFSRSHMQCCRSYCFHFTFAIITISSLCAHKCILSFQPRKSMSTLLQCHYLQRSLVFAYRHSSHAPKENWSKN